MGYCMCNIVRTNSTYSFACILFRKIIGYFFCFKFNNSSDNSRNYKFVFRILYINLCFISYFIITIFYLISPFKIYFICYRLCCLT